MGFGRSIRGAVTFKHSEGVIVAQGEAPMFEWGMPCTLKVLALARAAEPEHWDVCGLKDGLRLSRPQLLER